jgi:hypothetical protein
VTWTTSASRQVQQPGSSAALVWLNQYVRDDRSATTLTRRSSPWAALTSPVDDRRREIPCSYEVDPPEADVGTDGSIPREGVRLST